MCDHCLKRDRAYHALPFDQQAEVDAFTSEAETRLVQAQAEAFFGGEAKRTEWEESYLMFGDTLDTMLGIASAPEFPPDWATG